MQEIEISGVQTLKGFGTDKHGNPTATLKGETGYTGLNPIVGDHWRDMNIGAQYIVETRIIPVQASIDDDQNQTTIDYDEDVDDGDLLLPEGVE